MKILITGSNGFLGAALVERLLVHGETNIRCLVRPGSNRCRLESLEQKLGVRLTIVSGSLASKEAAARALDGADVVLHAAAAMSKAPADIFMNTVVTSKNLLEAVVASRRPIKIGLVSSFGVYGVAGMPRGHTIDESTPLEPHPEKRDVYSYAKLRQEKLFWEYQARWGFPLVVLRPGVIYGPGGNAFSNRVGLELFGVFFHLGGDNVLPLSYVDNCAEALVIATMSDAANGQAYNVHDDDLPTCRAYLERYRREVRRIRTVSVPYFALAQSSKLIERYHAYSKGQLPAILTPYKTATVWKGNRFDNRKLKSLGWKQLLSTEEGLRRTFADMRDQLS